MGDENGVYQDQEATPRLVFTSIGFSEFMDDPRLKLFGF
jgi:hypothetical protein